MTPVLTQSECDDMDEMAEFAVANADALAALDRAARTSADEKEST